MHFSTLAVALLAGNAFAWMPQDRDLEAFNQTASFEKLGKRFKPTLPNGQSKIRGVNFGGWLISEPWMMQNEWNNVMGCKNAASEFDCMRNVYSGSNRAAGNTKFANHWRDWITPATVQAVKDVGLNTIRIPIGYWSFADIVDKASEPFADPGPMLGYLDAVIKKAADLGMYVIIDLHGAPGGQQEDAFSGQIARPSGFYNSYNFGRAQQWLSWMTKRIHNNDSYRRAVGMIQVLNEPVSQHDPSGRYPAPGQVPGLIQSFYPAALKAVRDAEASLNVPASQKLHVQYMSSKWLSGNPRDTAAVANDALTGFDDHNYIGFGVSNRGDRTQLMQSACRDSRVVNGQSFAITGEWSMTSDVDWKDADFFKKFFTAQQQLYEKPGMNGWVYWTWKTELNDPRWTYSYATSLGYVPNTAAGLENNVYQNVCAGFT